LLFTTEAEFNHRLESENGTLCGLHVNLEKLPRSLGIPMMHLVEMHLVEKPPEGSRLCKNCEKQRGKIPVSEK
jgi:hypothetical protein